MVLRFDGKVVVIVGVDDNIGQQYSLFFAKRGASVLINNQNNSSIANKIAQSINKSGGIVAISYEDVQYGSKIIKKAIDSFGKVDIIINNTQVVREIPFQKMCDQDWNIVIKKNLYGSYSCVRAAWNIMRQQNFGRIINISSMSGLSANSSATKLGLHGFTLALAKEGEKRNICVNTIGLSMGKHNNGRLAVSLGGYLCNENCNETGSLFEVRDDELISKLRWERSEGVFIDPETITPEDIVKKWEQISSFERKNNYPNKTGQILSRVMEYNKVRAPKL